MAEAIKTVRYFVARRVEGRLEAERQVLMYRIIYVNGKYVHLKHDGVRSEEWTLL